MAAVMPRASRIPLGPADYIFTGAGSEPITFAFHFRNPLDPDALRKSLSGTLGSFPPVQGGLAQSSENAYAFHLAENALELETRDSDLPFAESRALFRYLSPVESRVGHPLARISLTRTPDGSVLAASISHALVDGFSYFHFLTSWARVCRGEQFLPPDLSREGALFAEEDGGEPVDAAVLLDRCGLHLAGSRSTQSGAAAREERIPLSSGELKALLEQANRDRPGVPFSENDVLTAWLWQRFLPRWIEEPGDHQTWVTCPVDCRRIFKALPRRYFGCALCFASASVSLGRLRQAPLGELASCVHDAVRRVTNDFAALSMSTLGLFRRQHGPAAMENLHLTHPRHGMVVTNLTRMPLRDLDFGNGAPEDFLVHSDVSGSAALLPSQDGVLAVVIHP